MDSNTLIGLLFVGAVAIGWLLFKLWHAITTLENTV
jgi:hypothetical protein